MFLRNRIDAGEWNGRIGPRESPRELGIIHRRAAYHHPEANSYIEQFHRSLKEEEV